MLIKNLKIIFVLLLQTPFVINCFNLKEQNEQTFNNFIISIEKYDNETFQKLLPHVDINAIFEKKFQKYSGIFLFTPLKLAIFEDNKLAFDILINDKRINLENELGALVLIQSISKFVEGTEYFFNVLMNKYINVNLISKSSQRNNIRFETALIFVVLFKHFEAIKVLVENGANVNYQDSLGKTALDYVFENTLSKQNDAKSLEICKYLTENGAVSGTYKKEKEKLNNALQQVLTSQFDNQIINLISSYIKP